MKQSKIIAISRVESSETSSASLTDLNQKKHYLLKVKMSYHRLIGHAMQNKLCTLKCTTRKNDSRRPTYLLGMGDFEKKKDCTKGWIILFSGNPMFPHDEGETYFNKIDIGKLDLTLTQTKELLKSSDVPDLCVYLYAGEFCIDNCQKPSNLDQPKIQNILKILCNRIDEGKIEFDETSVVQFKVQNLKNIIKPKKLKMKNGSYWKRREGSCAQMGETFEFRATDRKVYVDFKRPVKHSGYELELIFSQHVISKSRARHSVRKQRITTVLHHVKMYMHPTFLNYDHENIKGKNSNSSEVTTIKKFRVPDYVSERDHQVYEKYKVQRVEFWAIARIIRRDGWRESTMGKVLIQEPVNSEDGNHHAAGVKVRTSFPNDYLYSRTPSLTQYYMDGKCSSSSFSSCDTHTYSGIDGKLEFIDLFLDINKPGKNATRSRANTL